jgi:TPR repeat protein
MGAKAGWIILVAWLVTAGAAFGLTGPELASEFDRGLKAYDAKDYRSAFVIWWQIKNQDLAAMRNVGLMLRKGEGVVRNPKAAEKVLWTAAATGMANAKVDLAEMYLNGETGPPAPKKALTLLQEASAVGHPLGQFLLAQMYEDGNGVTRDMNRATELYIAAARGGLHEAKLRLAALGTDRPASPLPQAEDAKPEPAVPAVAPVPAVPPCPRQPLMCSWARSKAWKPRKPSGTGWARCLPWFR